MPRGEPHILISGGGTGGHIFPALAIARKVKDILPEARILFVGARGKMEMEKVPEAGFPIEGLWISGIKRELSADNLLFPVKMVSSLCKSWKIIRSFRPDIAVGVGGFASGPALKMASIMGVPILIQEQNSYPGITNKWLARSADRICVAYPGMEAYFPQDKIVLTGNPVRREIVNIEGKRGEAAVAFNLPGDQKTLLVFGGSQGALSINRAVKVNLGPILDSGLQVLWQTGKGFYQEALAAANDMGEDRIRVMEFIKRMDLAYALADMVIARSGAIAIAELSIVAKPVIFVPLPSAAEDHQFKNASRLARENAAWVVRDHEAAEKISSLIREMAGSEAVRNELATNIGRFAMPDADDRIAREIITLIRTKK
jgi:UDP-N-acetylglucosamine--N-acetylmuramyl-(pentapeptide) pyrophosphoryl-undecaprenol N-acetylglucosamine transferase